MDHSVQNTASVKVLNPRFVTFTALFLAAASFGVRLVVSIGRSGVAVVLFNSIRDTFSLAVVFIIFTAPVIAVKDFFVISIITYCIIVSISIIGVIVGVTAYFIMLLTTVTR